MKIPSHFERLGPSGLARRYGSVVDAPAPATRLEVARKAAGEVVTEPVAASVTKSSGVTKCVTKSIAGRKPVHGTAADRQRETVGTKPSARISSQEVSSQEVSSQDFLGQFRPKSALVGRRRANRGKPPASHAPNGIVATVTSDVQPRGGSGSEIMDNFERRASECAKRFPTERDALEAMSSAYARLIDLGWRSPAYYESAPKPKDDEVVWSITIGSPQLHYGSDPWPGYTLFRTAKLPNPPYRLMADMDRAARRILSREEE